MPDTIANTPLWPTKKEFVDWLNEIHYFLPPKMSLHEANLLFERKLKEEAELNA